MCCFLSAKCILLQLMLQFIAEEEACFPVLCLLCFFRKEEDLFSISAFKKWYLKGDPFLLSDCKSECYILYMPFI